MKSKRSFFHSHFLVALLAGLLLTASACKREDERPSPSTVFSQDFSNEGSHNDKSRATDGVEKSEDEALKTTSLQRITGLQIEDIGSLEIARYLGGGIENVVVDGQIYSADEPQVKNLLASGAPLCLVEFSEAASLVHDFKLQNQLLDDTQVPMQSALNFEDSEGNTLSINCLHTNPLTDDFLQENFRGMIRFSLAE